MKEKKGYIVCYKGGEMIEWRRGEVVYKKVVGEDVVGMV